MFDFPNSPTLNQIAQNPVSGANWQWDGVKWEGDIISQGEQRLRDSGGPRIGPVALLGGPSPTCTAWGKIMARRQR